MALDGGVGYAVARDGSASCGGYARIRGSIENLSYLRPGTSTLTIRLNGGLAPNAPLHRSIFASSRDPWETFNNDCFRPRGAAFKQPNFTLIPLGGARLRGFSSLLGLATVVSANLDATQRLAAWTARLGRLPSWVVPFVASPTA